MAVTISVRVIITRIEADMKVILPASQKVEVLMLIIEAMIMIITIVERDITVVHIEVEAIPQITGMEDTGEEECTPALEVLITEVIEVQNTEVIEVQNTEATTMVEEAEIKLMIQVWKILHIDLIVIVLLVLVYSGGALIAEGMLLCGVVHIIEVVHLTEKFRTIQQVSYL